MSTIKYMYLKSWNERKFVGLEKHWKILSIEVFINIENKLVLKRWVGNFETKIEIFIEHRSKFSHPCGIPTFLNNILTDKFKISPFTIVYQP